MKCLTIVAAFFFVRYCDAGRVGECRPTDRCGQERDGGRFPLS